MVKKRKKMIQTPPDKPDPGISPTASIGETQETMSMTFKSVFKKSAFSRKQLGIFALIFAAIGGYLLISSFAASAVLSSVEGENMAPQAASTSSTTNLALGKPATASSTQSYNGVAYSPSGAFDGNTTTRWSSNYSDPQWIEVDLGSDSVINRVVLNWEAAYGKAYQIQTSANGSVWTTIYSTASGTGGTNDLSVNGLGRYVRMYGTTRGTQYGYSLYEMQVYGLSNLASNKPATSSSTQTYNGVTYSPANAFDGNTSTRWSSNYSDPQWLQVDLGSSLQVSRVVLRWEAAYGKAYQIQTSNDGSTWTSVYSTASGSGGVNDLSVNGSGRYVRMYATARGTQYGYSLYEMEVYGSGGASAPTIGQIVSDSQASNGKDMELYSNGAVSGTFSLTSSAASITVMAKSSLCSSIGGAMTVNIDGAQVISTTVNATSFTPYNASVNLVAGQHTLVINFTNDAYIAGVCDRNLYIDVTNFYAPSGVTPAPSVSLSAAPTSVTSGQSSTLIWASTNATQCTASGAWTGQPGLSGSKSTGALNQTSTYSLTCTGSGGTASSSATVTVTAGSGSPDLTTGFFTTNSFWRLPIPATAQIDPNSANWVNMILANTQVDTLHINHDYWTTTLYHASASTPKVTFAVTNSNKHINLPYQSAWVTAPSPDTDKAIAIIDDTNGCEYETQGFVASTRTIHAVRVSNVWTGSGAHAADAGVSGGELPTVGGLITPQQAASGVIKHALRWASPFNSPNYVMPGTRSDGTHAGGVPQGELMRLDPALNLSQLGLNSFQLMLAKALQTYGAYDSDSGAAFTVYVESSFDGSQYNNTNWAFPRAILSHLQFITPLYSGSPLMTNSMPGCSNPY